MLGEMFDNKLRAAALEIATSVQWVANSVISTSFPPLLQYFGLGAAYDLCPISAAISFLSYFC